MSARRQRNSPAARHRRRQQKESPLMMASMLDILMAVLFFLLKNYTTVVSDFSVSKDITLPRSTAMQRPEPALQLVVTQKAILLDDKEVVKINNGKIAGSELWKDGVTIIKLAQALKAQKDKALYIQQRSDKTSFTGVIVMQADQSLKFDLLKKVIYTAGVQDFVMLRLAVIKKDA